MPSYIVRLHTLFFATDFVSVSPQSVLLLLHLTFSCCDLSQTIQILLMILISDSSVDATCNSTEMSTDYGDVVKGG
ncbi:hypothetical protein V1511DRAFT_94020 [Dipodascopsis uninucleata]